MHERKVDQSFVRVKTRTELLQGVPDRWAAQYPANRYGSKTDKGQIREKLYALGIWERTRERINSIIGNESWTSQRCDRCRADSDVLLEIGQEPDYDARWINICPECVREIATKYAGDVTC